MKFITLFVLIYSFYSNAQFLDRTSENLRIGTYILKNQLQGRWIPEVKGRLLTKRNYYWEVLNDEYKGRVIKSFHNNRANLPFCQDY